MLKLGIISDIHSHEFKESSERGGWYFPSMPDMPIKQNPFAALKKLIDENEIELDYLLSPGDYAHKIDPKGLKSAWEQLKLITIKAKAKYLIGTIGNHDVSSRDSEIDSFKFIKKFDVEFPVYPINNTSEHREDLLGQKSYYTFEDDDLDILFIVINSCFDHWNKIEASKGKVKVENLEDIQTIITESTKQKKIMMIHHNPIVHETGIQDTDVIEGTEELLRNLKGVDMTIYGHKHDFRFTQFKKHPKNENALGSGSFSCFKTEMKTGGLNAFHIIEFSPEEVDECINHGIIKTYLYTPSTGWYIANYLEEGFGCIYSESQIENKLSTVLSKSSNVYEDWKDVITANPYLKYITTENRKNILNQLRKKGVIKRFTYNENQLVDTLILK